MKILGNGELTKKLTVTAHRFSATAREKIEQAGGTANALREPVVRTRKRRTSPPPEAEAEPEATEPESEEESAAAPEAEAEEQTEKAEETEEA